MLATCAAFRCALVVTLVFGFFFVVVVFVRIRLLVCLLELGRIYIFDPPYEDACPLTIRFCNCDSRGGRCENNPGRGTPRRGRRERLHIGARVSGLFSGCSETALVPEQPPLSRTLA